MPPNALCGRSSSRPALMGLKDRSSNLRRIRVRYHVLVNASEVSIRCIMRVSLGRSSLQKESSHWQWWHVPKSFSSA